MKTKIEKHKKIIYNKIIKIIIIKNPTYSLSPPHLFQKKMSLMDLFWGGNEKFMTLGSIWPYVKIYFL